MSIKAYYNVPVWYFLKDDAERILGVLTAEHHHALDEQQRWAWLQQFSILKAALDGSAEGRIFFEFYIPRMGKRVDAVLVFENVVFVIEFKAGANEHLSSGFDQVEDYALDLKNFMKAATTSLSFRCWSRLMLKIKPCRLYTLLRTLLLHRSGQTPLHLAI